MPAALGMIEVKGLPPALAVGDAMVKGGRVTLVGYEKVSSMRYTALIRGVVSEVTLAVEAGVAAMKNVNTEEDLLFGYHVIANPHPNLEAVFTAIAFNKKTDRFRE
jgi:carbon dioxide concentrating mechanism protein CcmK